MSDDNGVIKIGRKGVKKFAFGEDGQPFEVDVVKAFQAWICLDDEFRPQEEDEKGDRPIPLSKMPDFHQAAVVFVKEVSKYDVTIAEALDFIARLREQYDELVNFFRPRSKEERDSPDTSGAELRFSAEES